MLWDNVLTDHILELQIITTAMAKAGVEYVLSMDHDILHSTLTISQDLLLPSRNSSGMILGHTQTPLRTWHI